MKKTISLITFIFILFIDLHAQSAYNFNPTANFQYTAADANGQVYAIKFAKDAKRVERTMLIDLNTNESRITYYDETGNPLESYQNSNSYVYVVGNGKIDMISVDESENTKIRNDLNTIQEYGINLSFMDQLVSDNSNWMEVLSQNKKYLDAVVACTAYTETGLACIATWVNPLMAIPCTSGLINIIGKNYNKTNPTLSTAAELVSSEIDFLNKYLHEEKPITKWSILLNVIDIADATYNEKKESNRQLAEQIRSLYREELILRSNQSTSFKGNVDNLALKNRTGIIGKAILEVEKVNKEVDRLEKTINIHNFKDIASKVKDQDSKRNTIKLKAETQYNDSLNGIPILLSWKKIDREGYYSINKVVFKGIRWNYGRVPFALIDIYFSCQKKPILVNKFGDIEKVFYYMRDLGIVWKKDGNVPVNGLLGISKSMRDEGVVHFSLDWNSFTTTPVFEFDKSSFRFDYTL